MGAEIFQGFLQAPKSIQDYENEYADATSRRQANALRAMAMQQQVDTRGQAQARQNALQQIAGQLSPSATMQERVAAMRRNPLLWGDADALETTDLKRRDTESQIGERNATADKTKDAMSADRHRRNVQQLLALGGPQEAISGLQQQIQRGEVDPNMGGLLLKTVPQDPAAFNTWKLQMIASLGDPKAMVEMLKPHLQTVNLGGQQVQQAVDPLTGKPTTTGTMQNTQSPDNAATVGASRANNRDSIAAENERARLTRDQGKLQYDADRGVVVNLGTGNAVPAMAGGAPIGPKPGAKPTDQQQKAADATEALALLDQAEPLLGAATNSYIGQGVDQAARAFGKSTPGSEAAAQLKALEGALIAKMPKMSGPQSDKDVLLYKQMAGQIGDATIPADQKRAAIKTIREINQRQSGAPAAPAPQPAGGAAKVRNDADYAALPSGATFVGPDGKTRRKP